MNSKTFLFGAAALVAVNASGSSNGDCDFPVEKDAKDKSTNLDKARAYFKDKKCETDGKEDKCCKELMKKEKPVWTLKELKNEDSANPNPKPEDKGCTFKVKEKKEEAQKYYQNHGCQFLGEDPKEDKCCGEIKIEYKEDLADATKKVAFETKCSKEQLMDADKAKTFFVDNQCAEAANKEKDCCGDINVKYSDKTASWKPAPAGEKKCPGKELEDAKVAQTYWKDATKCNKKVEGVNAEAKKCCPAIRDTFLVDDKKPTAGEWDLPPCLWFTPEKVTNANKTGDVVKQMKDYATAQQKCSADGISAEPRKGCCEAIKKVVDVDILTNEDKEMK